MTIVSVADESMEAGSGERESPRNWDKHLQPNWHWNQDLQDYLKIQPFESVRNIPFSSHQASWERKQSPLRKSNDSGYCLGRFLDRLVVCQHRRKGIREA